MARQKLSKTVVEGIAPSADDIVIWDTALPGFGVRVKPTGVRSYIVQYRNRETGASKRMTVGQHGPLLTFEQARKRARTLLADVMSGDDPSDERRAKRKAPTLSNLATEYLEKYATPKKRPKSVRDDRSMLTNIIIPKLGSQKVAAVGRREIEDLHASLQDRPYQANRVLALLSKMFNLAVEWHWRTSNPVKGIKRYEEEKRDRWLQDGELQRLCDILDAHSNQRAANAIRLQLLTGARMGEILGAKKVDFDLQRGVWRKPSHQTKQKRTEHLPLSAQAVALVASLMEGSPGTEHLFPGNVAGAPLKDVKKFWASAMRQAGITGYRRHDNRHTFASHLVSSGLSLEIVGRLLGHTNPSTTKRYAHLADDPLRTAANRFASKMTDMRS